MNARTLMLVAGTVMFATESAVAQDKHWNGNSSDSWFNAANWSPSGVPGSGNQVFIDPSSSKPVVIQQPGALSNAGWIGLNNTFAHLTIRSGGSLISGGGGVVIGSTTNSRGEVVLQDLPSFWQLTGNLIVGDRGRGFLTVSNGGDLRNFWGVIGSNDPGEGSVVITGSGSIWWCGEGPFVGLNGRYGSLRIEDGGIVMGQGASSSIAQNSITTGEVLVTGNDSGLLLDCPFVIGQQGDAELRVENGGMVAALTTWIAANTSSQSEAIVDGAGSTLDAEGLMVGYQGIGSLIVRNGGQVTTTYVNFATQPGASGSGSVSGANSLLSAPDQFHIGERSTGSLEVRDGGRIHGLWLTVGRFESGDGTLTIGSMSGSPPRSGIVDTPMIEGGEGTATLNFRHSGVNLSGDAFFLQRPSSDPVVLQGSLRVNQLGPGHTVLPGNNTFTGPIDVSGGVLRTVVDAGLGNASNVVTLRTGGVLMNQEEALTLPATRSINLSSGEGRLRAGWFRVMRIQGSISGPGDLVITNDNGIVELAGSTKTYTGATVIGRDPANGGIGNVSTLRLVANNVIPTTTHLRFNAGAGGNATLNLNGRNQTVQSLSFLSGDATLTGAGTLSVTGLASGTPVAGTLNLVGPSTLDMAGGLTPPVTTVVVGSGATLKGTGGVGPLVLQSGGIIAPGSSVGGILSQDATWNGGGVLNIEINDASLDFINGASVGWDIFGSFGVLDIAATPANPIVIRLATLDPNSGAPGNAAGFDPGQSYTWMITSVFNFSNPTPITGFDPAAFVFDDSNFLNAHGGSFSVSLFEGAAIMLHYTRSSCAADLSGSADQNDPAYGVPDGTVDSSDFFYYLDQFSAGNLAVADLTGSADSNDPSYGVPNGAIDADDFFYYLDQFVIGCP